MTPYINTPKRKERVYPDITLGGLHTIARRVTDNVVMQDDLVPTCTIGKKSESIIYSTRRRNYRAKSNFCKHFRETFNYGGGSDAFSTLGTSPSPDWLYEYRNHHRACCDYLSSMVSKAKTLLGGNFEQFYLGSSGQTHINTAFDRIRPDLRTVSIPNFLADIDDIKRLYKLWKRNVGIAKNVAGLHLNYKFGWKPTVGDLRDLIEGITKLQKKLKAFEDSIGKVLKDSTNLESSSNTVQGVWDDPGLPGSVTYSATVQRTCTGAIAYAPQPLAVMGPMDKVLRGLLDSLGFELNPRIIWDAIPFTFVLDWFFGVGSWLDRFRVDALELPILLVDSYLSYKQTLTIEWVWKGTHLVGFVPVPVSGGAVYQCTYFHRMPIYPDYATLSGLGWKLPTLNQAALGVSLATVLARR
jgi:hypothetical protein